MTRLCVCMHVCNLAFSWQAFRLQTNELLWPLELLLSLSLPLSLIGIPLSRRSSETAMVSSSSDLFVVVLDHLVFCK